MEGIDVREVLSRDEKRLFCVLVGVVFLSLQLSNSPFILLLLWLCAAGLMTAYALFRVLPRAPNLLVHMKQPPHLLPRRQRRRRLSLDTGAAAELCGVCGRAGCNRLQAAGKRKPYLNPWDGLVIPSTVDKALSEFLEIVMGRFVYSWHRRLVPEAESFEDHLRVMIRYACAMLLRRAQRLDIPHLIMHKFLPAAAAHIHIYMKARSKLSADAPISIIEEAVMREYGDHLHVAMRGPAGNLRYFRQAVHSLLPLLLPKDMLTSKFMCEFIEELFAAKVCLPTMNKVAKPDFLNKMLLIMFDPHSKLMRMYGPNSKEVTLLSAFIGRRVNKSRPLDIPLPELISPAHNLYAFMQFMKAQDCIHVLNVYLSLDDLKAKINGFLDNKPEDLVAQIQKVYETYMCSCSPMYIPLDGHQVAAIAKVLEDDGKTAAEKCEQLKSLNVFGRLRGYIYHELFTKMYCPQFHNSPQFYGLHLTKPKAVEVELGDRKGDRWRQKSKQLKFFFMRSEERTRSESIGEGRESPSVGEATPTAQQLTPYKVQIIDVDTRTDGIRPYSLYVLLVRKEGENGKVEVVRRRYKEFMGLDAKLRQFLPQISVQLPSKRTFRNLDRAFVEARAKELDAYLQALIAIPGVQESQVLASFLSESSDPSLFMPDSVGDKAGKMIKSVPSMLIGKDKSSHMDDLLPSLVSEATRPPAQTSDATVAEVIAMINANRATTEGYLNDAADDDSDSETTRLKPWLKRPKFGEPLPVDSVMDILMFVAVTVYKVNPLQLTALQMAKLLGQNSIETLVYNFVSEKIELMLGETKLVEVIHLFRDNIFFNKDPPRTEDEIRKRLDETLNHLFNYPRPLFVSAVGQQRYKEGTALIIEGLQCRELNKVLFFNLLDVILIELFPELVEPSQQD